MKLHERRNEALKWELLRQGGCQEKFDSIAQEVCGEYQCCDEVDNEDMSASSNDRQLSTLINKATVFAGVRAWTRCCMLSIRRHQDNILCKQSGSGLS